jgi:serine/threonine protein kinase
MNPEQWQRLNDLFQAVLLYPPEERAAFLTHACAGNEEIRAELQSLLDADEQTPNFLEKPAIVDAAKLLAANQSQSLIGKGIAHYRIEDKLGSGGMGDVYLARDVKLGRKVALKVLPSIFIRDQDRLLRFRQEARLVLALNHPNIVTIYDVGETPDAYYIATEFIEGCTLRERISQGGMTAEEVLDISIQLASALSAAHKADIIHRDIKPENIILRPDGYVKVLDFGIAKLTANQGAIDYSTGNLNLEANTAPGIVIGTVNYMSPEQARGQTLDSRTDIFSLGVVIYEMVAGRLPFEGETFNHVIITILEKEPLPINQYIPDLPEELECLVRKALQKNKEERYQLVKEILVDLKKLRQNLEAKAEVERSFVVDLTEIPDQSTTIKHLSARITDESVDTVETSASQSFTDRVEYCLRRTLAILYGNKREKRFLLFTASLLILFNPFFLPYILRVLNLKSSTGFTIVWGAVAFILFVVMIWVAVKEARVSPRSAQPERQAIKGLRPFSFQDADVFAQLQRQESLRECLATILDDTFRFGVLCGESGCGKTSFLQAGIWPSLNQQNYKAIYIKFSDSNPFESIRDTIQAQLQLPEEVLESDNLLGLFQSIKQVYPTPLVLLLDQFEQFFVHHKRKIERKAFVQDLADWYQKGSSLPVKILVCIRGDFNYRLIELQKALGYFLGPHDSFRLEKFEPGEAAEVFRIIAQTEDITFDEDFVKEVVTQELASREDGLISPVDVQILAWMIASQRATDERGFNRRAYQKLGGVEGLLERFLRRTLKIRETESRRHTAIKTLLSLTDLERNTRGRALTISEMKRKLTGTTTPNEIEETIRWLARSDVRLLTPLERNDVQVYELAHERLIPALRRIAGQELSESDQANQLLDQRVNEWLANNRSSHFLLRWHELRLIQRYQVFLIWGTHRDQKEFFLARSRRKIRLAAIAFSFVILLGLSYFGFLYSPWGQIWRIKQEIISLSERIHDDGTKLKTIEALAYLGDFDQALKMAEKLNWSSKISAKVSIARAFVRIGKNEKNDKLIEEGRRLIEELDFIGKEELLFPLEQFYSEVGDSLKANAFLKQKCNELEKKGPESIAAFSRYTEAWRKIGVPAKAEEFLEQTRKDIDLLDSNSRIYLLPSLAQNYAEIGNSSNARSLIEEFYQASSKLQPDEQMATFPKYAEACIKIYEPEELLEKLEDMDTMLNRLKATYHDAISLDHQGYYMFAIVNIYIKSGLIKKDKRFLERARFLFDQRGYGIKYMVLSELANAYSRLQDREVATELIKQVMNGADRFPSFTKRRCYMNIVECYARLGDWSMARQIAEQTSDDESHLDALIRIVRVWVNGKIPDQFADDDIPIDYPFGFNGFL